MWDTVQTATSHLSHDMPCLRCGHAAHTFLACDDTCDCQPSGMPGMSGMSGLSEMITPGALVAARVVA